MNENITTHPKKMSEPCTPAKKENITTQFFLSQSSKHLIRPLNVGLSKMNYSQNKYIFIVLLLFTQISFADDTNNNNVISPLIQFATNGLNLAKPLMGQPTKDALSTVGLPENIQIHKSASYWDIDIEETPAEWVYSGFSLITLYYRDGFTEEGSNSFVTGPYYGGNTVKAIKVTDTNVKLKFGIHVGADKSIITEKLGQLDTRNNSKTVTYVANVINQYEGDIRVTFKLNDHNIIEEILWSFESWH